jgi:Cdc6-like AAA superfamily ATPase
VSLECLASLSYDDIRYSLVSEEHKGSLEWLWDHERYQEWLAARRSSLLYIEGKPGSGKSTLAKYFNENFTKKVPNAASSTIARYFYTERGSMPERTHRNMLRSVLCSILEQDESTFFHFQSEFRVSRNANEWPYGYLKNILSSFASHPTTKPIFLILDAMDESEETDRYEITRLLCELCSPENPCSIKVFLARRPCAELNHLIHGGHFVIAL